LTHYYTGIHVRDANNGNTILTPPRRFAVLSVNGGPAPVRPVCATGTVYLTVRLQNTGTETWGPHQVGIGYCWGSVCHPLGYLSEATSVALGAVWPSQGEMGLWVEPGVGELSLDLYYHPPWQPWDAWFSSDQSLPWFRQSLQRVVSAFCRHLPFINRAWPLQ
jgi:hypothetical protein